MVSNSCTIGFSPFQVMDFAHFRVMKFPIPSNSSKSPQQSCASSVPIYLVLRQVYWCLLAHSCWTSTASDWFSYIFRFALTFENPRVGGSIPPLGAIFQKLLDRSFFMDGSQGRSPFASRSSEIYPGTLLWPQLLRTVAVSEVLISGHQPGDKGWSVPLSNSVIRWKKSQFLPYSWLF